MRTPLNAIKGYGEMLREDVANFSSDSLRADLDRLLVAATDLLVDRKRGMIPIRRDGQVAVVPLRDVIAETRRVPRELYDLQQVFG